MDEAAITTILTAQDAAEALIALGWPIAPDGPDIERWRIVDSIMKDEELIGRATRRGFQLLSARLQ